MIPGGCNSVMLIEFSHILSCTKIVEYPIVINVDIDDSSRAVCALFVSGVVQPPNEGPWKI